MKVYLPFWRLRQECFGAQRTLAARSLPPSPPKRSAQEKPRSRSPQAAGSSSSLQELVLKIINPVIALIVENIRVDVIGFFESAAAGLEVRMESGNIGMRRKIIR